MKQDSIYPTPNFTVTIAGAAARHSPPLFELSPMFPPPTAINPAH